MDVWEYFEQKEREFDELSLAPERSGQPMFFEEAGSGGKRGRVLCNVFLTDDAYLSVSEVVVVQNDHVHREEYGYFLVIGGEEIWGEERDPSHDPPVHRHTRGHVREDSVPKSFKQVAGEAWEEITRRAQEGAIEG